MQLETVLQRLASGDYVADIGQLDPATRKHLDKLARAGSVVKYRGFWDTGSSAFGLGPLKTCFRAASH